MNYNTLHDMLLHLSLDVFVCIIHTKQMWHDQGEWVWCHRYWFWDIGKERVQIPLLNIVFSVDKLFITLLCSLIVIRFASKCNIFKLPEFNVKISKLKIFNMWLISLDRVTNVSCNVLKSNHNIYITFY